MHKFIDLFCGIGGFRVALEKEGMECVFSCDIDRKVRESYYANFKDHPKEDITEIDVKDIPPHDILCAGFPCQSFSINGKQGGLDDNRGRLFYDVLRIVKHRSPHILLLENVKNILSVDEGRVIATIQNKLDHLGYNVKYSLLNSSFFGIPQKRERVYFVCFKKDTSFKFMPPKPTSQKIFLQDIMDKKANSNLYLKKHHVINWRGKVDDYAMHPIRVGYINKGSQGDRIYSHRGHSVTLSATSGGIGARTGLYTDDTGGVRKLSQAECKRLMGFTDSHVISDGIEGLKQLGNAVMPPMISKIYTSIIL